MSFEEGAACFARAAVETFGRYGLRVGHVDPAESFRVGDLESVVLLGLVGGWRGAVAFRFDEEATAATAEAVAGEPIEEPGVRREALLEAVNVVGGRGAAALAGKHGKKAVWLTPPLLARGPGLGLRLVNLEGSSFKFPLGSGSGGLLFAAAPEGGGLG